MFNGAKNLVITGGTFTHYNVESSGLEILHKQTSPSAFHNSGERFDPPKCHPNTRVAVLNRIMDWVLAVASFDALIMWLYGPAGAGKSAIAQTIAEQCFERGLLLASFFFSRNDHNRNRSKPLIATLAYQVALTVPDARTHIESAVKKDPAIFERSLEAQLNTLIFDPLRQLCEAGFFNSPNFPHLIIIDGLDECGEAQMQCNILRSIANVVNKQRLPIIFLICSRPEQHISIEFNTGILDTITTRVVLDDTFLPEDDIRLFLKDSCETIKATHPLKKFIPSTWPEPASIDILVTKSSGQFIYASTVIKDIGHPRRRPTERLDVILGLRASRNMMPFAELDALYMHILSSIEDVAGALEILSTILVPRLQAGEEATKIREPRYLEEMLDLSPGDVYLTLVDLSSLLNCEQHEAPIQVFHASLGDFLLDKDRSKQFHIDIASAHAHMAHLCLQHLKNKTVGFPLNYIYGYLVEHTLNAAPTEQLHDDLLNCSLVHSVYATSRENPRTSYHWDIRYLLPKFIGRIKTLPFSDAEHLCAHNITILDEYLKTAFVEYASDPRLIASLAFTDPILGSACAETEAMYLQQNLLNFDKQLEDFDLHAIGLYSLCLEPHLMGLGPILYRDLLYQFLSDPSKAGDLYLSPAKYSLAAEYVLRYLTNSAINHAGSVMAGLNMLPKLLSKADRSDELLQLTTKDEWQECCSQFSERWQSSKEAISAYVSRCNGLS